MLFTPHEWLCFVGSNFRLGFRRAPKAGGVWVARGSQGLDTAIATILLVSTYVGEPSCSTMSAVCRLPFGAVDASSAHPIRTTHKERDEATKRSATVEDGTEIQTSEEKLLLELETVAVSSARR